MYPVKLILPEGTIGQKEKPVFLNLNLKIIK